MKISLDRLDVRALQVVLPAPGEQRIVVGEASGLRGALEQAGDRLSLSGVTAERVALEALHVLLGGLVLSSTTGATLEELGLTLQQSPGHLALDVTAKSLVALDLRVAVGDVVVAGRVELGDVRLAVRDDEGSLAAERVALSGFALRIGDVELAVEALAGIAVEMRWGAAGFSLTASTLEGPALRMTSEDLRLVTDAMVVRALTLDAHHVAVGHVALAGGRITASMRPPPSAPPPSAIPRAPDATPVAASGASTAEGEPRAPLVDWSVLDALSGEIDVDLDVDLTVPIIGSRQATHRFRVPIDGGTIDFRALEDNLSRLENALLDFSVREAMLVLERVNPLFPARGHGKPVVVWDLDAAELSLAETNRVRLAVLARARLVGSDDEEARTAEREPPSRSSIALRRLGLQEINVRLTLAPVEGPSGGSLHLRRIDSLALQGNVFHDLTAPPRAGRLLGEIVGVAAAIDDLRIGTNRLAVAGLAFASLSPLELAFTGVHPTNVQLDMAGVALEGLKLTLA